MNSNNDIREAYEERAAIMHYDGGLPLKEAERLAAEIMAAGNAAAELELKDLMT